MPLYNASLLTLDPAEVKRYAGLQKAEFPASRIRIACSEAKILSRPKAIWQLYAYDPNSSVVQSEPPLTLVGSAIRTHLAHCCKVIVLAATIGEAIETEITAQFQSDQYSAGLLLDAAATTAVESAIDQLEDALRLRFAKEGLRLVHRFSPGYGDWDIRIQPHLIELAHAQEIGIALTESCMLTPRKSVTAIIGMTAKELPGSAPHCQHCKKTNCPARKEINTV